MSTTRMILILLADLAMVGAGFYYGYKLLRGFRNFLLGLEWVVMAISGVNVLVLASVATTPDGAPDHTSFSYHLMVFFDAFSRSFGMTVILVIGMMAVTHRYRPTWIVEAVAILAGVGVGLNRALDPRDVEPSWAIFYLVMNLGAALFMLAFMVPKLWRAGDRGNATWVTIGTALGAFVAIIYDYVTLPGEDAEHSVFYIVSLSIWALMIVTFSRGYLALERINAEADARTAAPDGVTPRRSDV
ncbi:hypothetical protein [Tsukamurella pulmonis]|uniref:hypothetical protein n=1 Tax=Tsukamurella pulmonis TaxID=47312 RepID=UPI000E09212B|nr:hypothetical protein [Tsukamurella pulmonis]RDH09799.1 hypothetical protein DVB88_20935 [Tsukamurella pulmonis]